MLKKLLSISFVVLVIGCSSSQKIAPSQEDQACKMLIASVEFSPEQELLIAQHSKAFFSSTRSELFKKMSEKLEYDDPLTHQIKNHPCFLVVLEKDKERTQEEEPDEFARFLAIFARYLEKTTKIKTDTAVTLALGLVYHHNMKS